MEKTRLDVLGSQTRKQLKCILSATPSVKSCMRAKRRVRLRTGREDLRLRQLLSLAACKVLGQDFMPPNLRNDLA